MGIKSTYYIKRDLAIYIILSKINSCSDDELEDILEAFKESEYRNYLIVDNLPETRGLIESIYDFNKNDLDQIDL